MATHNPTSFSVRHSTEHLASKLRGLLVILTVASWTLLAFVMYETRGKTAASAPVHAAR